MKRIFLICILFLTLTINAQEKNESWGELSFDFGQVTQTQPMVNNVYSVGCLYSSLEGVLGYYITSDFSLGVGMGISEYNNPGINIIPIFIDLRYYPLLNKKVFVDGRIGKSLSTDESYFDAKFVSSIALGYDFLKFNKFKSNIAVGYSYCNFESSYFAKSKNINAFFLRLGISL